VLFNSLHFIVFLAAVFLLTMLLRRRIAARNAMLLVASYYFYGCWDWRFLGLIAVSTLVDYVCGRLLDTRGETGDGAIRTPRRRAVLAASVVANLGLLGVFKYYDFFAESFAAFAERLGFEAHPATLGVILPVGISFYTFQTLSYTIDVYRGRIPTERNLLTFALFVALFPQLVAGPIERASHLLPQLHRPTEITAWRLHTGFYLMCSGMFKKVVLADNVAKVADSSFAAFGGGAAPEGGGLAAYLGVIAFAIQIYCDFSGYTDIARGSARCMGFDLMVNFRLPYFAVNPRDFWARWHISLSTWLRDYLYIPLGGNRVSPLRTSINLMVTMVLGGLWHGAAWTFVLWGAYHGLLLCIHRAIRPTAEQMLEFRWKPLNGLRAIGLMVFFFHVTLLGWLLFRADSLGQAWAMLESAATAPGFDPALLGPHGVAILISTGLTLLAVQIAQHRSGDPYILLRLPAPLRALAYAGAALAFMVFGEYGASPFIYFQF
jgi:D-alanyl-lipoteichoic acid acyltransferase DltB (MBOAT superfamily)